MVEGIATVVVEIAIAIAQAALEISALIVVASIRPWRYLLSKDFRENTHMSFQGRSNIVKFWYLLWGTLAVLASLCICVALLWFFVFSPPVTPEPTAKEKTIQGIERAVIEHISKQKERNP